MDQRGAISFFLIRFMHVAGVDPHARSLRLAPRSLLRNDKKRAAREPPLQESRLLRDDDALVLQEITHGFDERLGLLVHHHVPRVLDRYTS